MNNAHKEKNNLKEVSAKLKAREKTEKTCMTKKTRIQKNLPMCVLTEFIQKDGPCPDSLPGFMLGEASRGRETPAPKPFTCDG
jgi:hypothetical protein